MIRNYCALAVFSVLILIAESVWAIETDPDPIHTQRATPWPNPLPGGFNPATDEHQHYNPDDLNGVAGKFDAYSVWDDNVYQWDDAGDMEVADFGHGYMQDGATYTFDPSVPKAAKPLFIRNVVNYWKSEINGRKLNTPVVPFAPHPVVTRMDFDRVAYNPMLPNGGADILIKFAATYPVGPAPQNPGDPPPVERPFPSSPPNSDGTMPGGGMYPPQGGGPKGDRNGVLAFWSPSSRQMTFNIGVNWFYDPVLLPGAGEFDFITTALHEFGHAIGLDHTGAAGTIMFGRQASDSVDGTSVVRTFNPGDGAKDGSTSLYTIAVPEPATASLLLCGLLLPLLARRRR